MPEFSTPAPATGEYDRVVSIEERIAMQQNLDGMHAHIAALQQRVKELEVVLAEAQQRAAQWVSERDMQQARAEAAESREAGLIIECREVEQVLGKALGYPWYKDDQKNFPTTTDADGVCVGEHTPGTIAVEAAKRLTTAEEEVVTWRRWTQRLVIDAQPCKPHHFSGYEYCRHNFLPDYCPFKEAQDALNKEPGA